MVSNKRIGLAIASIKKMIEEIAEKKESLLHKDLGDLGFSSSCYINAYCNDLFDLADILENADALKDIYESGYSIITLKENINSHVYKKYIRKTKVKSVFTRRLDSILQGKEYAEKYSCEFLEDMADWDAPKGFEPLGTIKVDDFIYEYDSQLEKNFIHKLKKDKYFIKFRGQNYVIPYRKRKHDKRYLPDIVLLNKKHNICIIEIKPLYNMPTDENLRKYKALVSHCNDNGFLYCMCDDDLNDINYLLNMDIDDEILEVFTNFLNSYDGFRYDAYKQLKECFYDYKEEDLKIQIAAIVYQYNLYMHGDLTNRIKKLLIAKKKASTI